MKVALCHDWLTGMRGGERVLDELAALYPGADLHTLVHVAGSTSERIDALRIHASGLSALPGIASHYRKLLPLFPRAIERLRVEPCDIVVSTSHAVAKGIRAPEGIPHLCYCFTPMRYVWDQIDAYLGSRGAVRRIATPLVEYLRRWDRRTSTPQRVTRFVAISRLVADRIRRHYDRSADVIYPPVRTDRIAARAGPPDDFYLLVGGFVPYKRDELAIRALAALGRPLVVAGTGPMRARLEASAPAGVRFVGRVSDERLADLYARCRALIYPQEEDFGIAAVEAQAAGRPVIAYAGGGALETVRPLGGEHPTGVFFREPEADSLCAAVQELEKNAGEFSPSRIRAHAETFSAERFRTQIGRAIEETRAAGTGGDRYR
jgi:glycosyltransferase involved in cell wall biosynthesis